MIFNMVYGKTWVPKEVDLLNDTSITGGLSGSLNHIYCYDDEGGGKSYSIHTNNMVDLSKYDKITFTVSEITWGGSCAYFCVSKTHDFDDSVAGSTAEFGATQGEVVLDVSGLSGEYYIIVTFHAYYKNGGWLTVSDIVMSKE